MPHTTRCCNDPYASKINPIFVENRTRLVDLSEPDPYERHMIRTQSKPGNPRFFQKIEIPDMSAESSASTSHTYRQKSGANVHCSRKSAQIRGIETGKSTIFTGIIRIPPKNPSYGTGSDKSTKYRQKWNRWHRLMSVGSNTVKSFGTPMIGPKSRNAHPLEPHIHLTLYL